MMDNTDKEEPLSAMPTGKTNGDEFVHKLVELKPLPGDVASLLREIPYGAPFTAAELSENTRARQIRRELVEVEPLTTAADSDKETT